MQIKFILLIALRYFSAKKNNKLVSFISAFSLLGVMLGVAALIVVMAVMEGFHIELVSNIVGLGGDVTISAYRGGPIENHKELVKSIGEIKHIKNIVPEVQSKALAVNKSESSGVIVRGMSHESFNSKLQLSTNIISGTIDNLKPEGGIAIGYELAYRMQLRVGDSATLICPKSVSTLIGSLPRKKTYIVEAIFKSGMFDYDNNTVILSLEAAQKLFGMGNGVNHIEIYSENHKDADYLVSQIRNIVPNELEVNSWEDSNSQFLNAIRVERVAMYTILSLIIIVAAFNIVSTLFMLVNEKRKDIAILKTMGASRGQILSVFIINGSLIGVIGTFLGVVLGVAFASNIEGIRKFLENLSGVDLFEAAIYFLYQLPSKILPENVISIAFMSIVLSVIATIYPAAKAASTDPAEALRNE